MLNEPSPLQDGGPAMGDATVGPKGGDVNNNNNINNREPRDPTADGSAIRLTFPSSNFVDPTPHLASLRDNHSSYTAVGKTCLLLNQFAANGSSGTVEDSTCIETSSLFHDTSFVQILSESFAALIECISRHSDRRAKILASKTAALVGRATYARLRHSTHVFSLRDATIHRLEDEVGTDVPMALCTAALDDPDDGVAATAMSSLGTMIHSTTSCPGTLVEDELLREILAIGAQAGDHPSPYAPGLKDMVDEDIKTPQTELQTRILESVITPRLLQLVSRFLAFDNPTHIGLILPTLTTSLVYLSKTAPPMIHPLDRTSYSKRWVELDYVSLVDDVVEGILIPLLTQSNGGVVGGGPQHSHLGPAAALATIRLMHACPSASWTRQASDWVIVVLQEEYGVTASLESQLMTLATIVIASRAVPLPDRVTSVLEFVVDAVRGLPTTTMAPSGIVSAGLLLEIGVSQGSTTSGGRNDGTTQQYRKPTRPALWAEVALSFFMDGPLETPIDGGGGGDVSRVRGHALTKFLKSAKILAILKDSNVRLREEFVTAFCMVAFQVGRRLRSSPVEGRGGVGTRAVGGGKPHNFLISRQDDVEEWIRMSLTVLKAFGSCIGWGEPQQPYMEEEMTMLVACQAAYTRLLQEVLHVAGLLSPTSVSMKMTLFASPPHIVWDQMVDAAEFLVQYDSVGPIESMIDPIGKLMDDIVRRDMKGPGIVSHHMRLFMLTLAADQWVQACNIASSHKRVTVPAKAATSGVGTPDVVVGMNVDSAKQILIAISPRRMFSKIVESTKSQVESFSKSKKERYKKFAQDTVTACVACIESMALMACYMTKRYGSTSDTKSVLNLSVQSLQGKTGKDVDAPVLPVCQGAIERIQSAFQSNQSVSLESMPASSLVPTDFKRKQIISSSRISQGRDAFNEAYLMQLSRQIISLRADMCMLSYPLVATCPAQVRKQNWLRLSLPPLPKSRNPQESISTIPRFAFGSNVTVCTAVSDPAAVTLAYSIRRNFRYDGAEEFRLMVTFRVHNVTAVDVPDGLRLELGIAEENVATSPDAQDVTSLEILKALTEGFEDTTKGNSLSSAVIVYKNEVKSGDHITWEVTLNPLPMSGTITLKPSLMYRGMEEEPPIASWVTADSNKKDGEDTSVTSGLSQKSGGSKSGEGGVDKLGPDRKQNITIAGEPMPLSPLIGLQPCPLVFFRDGRGDVDSFRFLWSRMPCQTFPLNLMTSSESDVTPSATFDALRLAAMSTVSFGGDHISGGLVSRLWAFMSPYGKRAMFVLAEQDSDKSKTLHVRGDDKQLLLCLTGTGTSRQMLVAALQPGLVPVE